MNGAGKRRALVACCFLAACFTAFSARLVQLQVAEHDDYAAKAAEKHVIKDPIYARRGVIEDVHGKPLAQNGPMKTVIADGSLIENQGAVAHLLAKPLKMTEAKVLERLAAQRFPKMENKNVPSPYIVVKKKVADSVAVEIAASLEAQKLRGIHFEPDSKRSYPNGSLLCHVIGFVNSENEGVDGIERNLDQYLRGNDGFRYIERDRTGRELVPYRGQERPPRNGFKVRLTVDMGLQQIVEEELDAAVKQFRPKTASVILMQPETGEILAMANRPNFDLNDEGDVPPEHRKNRAIADQYEPGSTFKIVAVSAALQQKLVTPDTIIFCENQHFVYGGSTLKDHAPYGDLSVNDIIMKSSNIGVAKLAIQLGDQKFYEYVRRFGFGERTGVNLPGEISGQVHPPHLWSKISITHVPMGQEIGTTPLQVVTAMAAIANGGRLMLPQIVHEVVDGEGNVVQGFKPAEVRRVISEQTAMLVRDALVRVTSNKGTAPLARVSGFKVAGKTGTAEKVGDKRGYDPDKSVVSFCGFMPADHPAFVALVMLDEAKTQSHKNYGGLVAAPVFSRIGERAARYLNLVPSPEPPSGELVITQRDIRD
jgi:cell division protein FtsI/penicillin-binding protein 2